MPVSPQTRRLGWRAQTNGTVDLTSMLPDLSSFSLQPQPVVVNGVTCQNWQLIQRLGSRCTSTSLVAGLQQQFAASGAVAIYLSCRLGLLHLAISALLLSFTCCCCLFVYCYCLGNTYNFYYDASNAMPVQYHMMGYDSLLGSHYDE